MDFAVLPPEVNSGRMYSGSGSAPMLAAAAAWEELAAQLRSAAASYEYQIECLVDAAWLGPSSASMAAAAATYVTWLAGTAAQAEQTATQAKAAAGAFEEAFSMTVPPPVIAANRSLLMSLVATNIFGQNTPAIAATEAQYAEMWAQDAAAMYGYASASANAAALTPFTPPPTVANPVSPSALASAVPTALQRFASPLQSASLATAPTGGLVGILQSLGFTSPLSLLTPGNTGLTATSLSGAYAAWGSASHADAMIISTQDQINGTENRIMSRFDELGRPAAAPSPASAGSGPASAASGQSAMVGRLSVPPGWAVSAPAMRTVARALPLGGLTAAPEGLATSPNSLFGELAMASTAMAGRAVVGPAYSGRWNSIATPTRAGEVIAPSGQLIGIAAELRELAGLRDAGILSDDEFMRQKRRLLGE